MNTKRDKKISQIPVWIMTKLALSCAVPRGQRDSLTCHALDAASTVPPIIDIYMQGPASTFIL